MVFVLVAFLSLWLFRVQRKRKQTWKVVVPRFKVEEEVREEIALTELAVALAFVAASVDVPGDPFYRICRERLKREADTVARRVGIYRQVLSPPASGRFDDAERRSALREDMRRDRAYLSFLVRETEQAFLYASGVAEILEP